MPPKYKIVSRALLYIICTSSSLVARFVKIKKKLLDNIFYVGIWSSKISSVGDLEGIRGMRISTNTFVKVDATISLNMSSRSIGQIGIIAYRTSHPETYTRIMDGTSNRWETHLSPSMRVYRPVWVRVIDFGLWTTDFSQSLQVYKLNVTNKTVLLKQLVKSLRRTHCGLHCQWSNVLPVLFQQRNKEVHRKRYIAHKILGRHLYVPNSNR